MIEQTLTHCLPKQCPANQHSAPSYTHGSACNYISCESNGIHNSRVPSYACISDRTNKCVVQLCHTTHQIDWKNHESNWISIGSFFQRKKKKMHFFKMSILQNGPTILSCFQCITIPVMHINSQHQEEPEPAWVSFCQLYKLLSLDMECIFKLFS